MAEQWAAPMGRLLSHYDRSADHTEKESRGQTGWDQRNLATNDGQVSASGDGEGGQGCLWDQTTGRWRGCRDRGRHSFHTCLMVGTLTGRGLKVSPY